VTSPVIDLLRLARLKQWSKGVFVIIGPIYGLIVNPAASAGGLSTAALLAVLGAFLAFGFASSFCYVINDFADREADRQHPRKRHRPLAAGRISPGAAGLLALALLALAGLSLALVPSNLSRGVPAWGWLGIVVATYIANVVAYSAVLKHRVVLDVISLSLGFVLRVIGGCAAVGVEPSSWLLNVTFFVSMFLALGKRLGERRALGAHTAALARGVHAKYTDDLLRMGVVVTGVASLLTYASYVQERAPAFTLGFNLLWLTMLPATYGLLRCMVLLERGLYDDPTEIGLKDRPTLAAAVVFAVLTVLLAILLKPAPPTPRTDEASSARPIAGILPIPLPAEQVAVR
jgi:decaprenyl-phosphate phosphoribosyltransferase